MRLLAIYLTLGTAVASPMPGDVAERAATTTANLCSTVQSLVSKYGAKSTATAFCSSYLGIKTRTLTATVTPTVTSTVPITEVVSTTVTTGTVTSLSVNTVTVTQLANCATTTAAAIKQKRNVEKPACLSSYSAFSILSSACSCLSIPTPSTTITVTGSPTFVVSTATATSADTQLASATVTSTATVNVASTLTSVVPQTVTVPGAAIPTTFFLQALSDNVTINGQFGRPINGPASIGGNIRFDQAPSDLADTFYLDEACNLKLRAGTSSGLPADSIVAESGYGFAGYPVAAYTTDYYSTQNYIPVTCAIVVATNILQCSDSKGRTLNEIKITDDTWFLETYLGRFSALAPFSIRAIAA
nr:hypothetical protein B0A51_11822 [Rachicladosporium sp. CCFEE 5018]